MKRVGLFLLSVVFLISSFVSAQIGVSPGYYEIDFKPNLKQNVYFEFTEDKGLPMEIFLEGDLSKYASLSTKRLENDGAVGVSLNLPNRIDIPGTHIIVVGARQVADENSGFGIVGSIKGQIRIIVPYPGQYATVKVSADDVNVGEPVKLQTTINNLGDENVDISGKIEIYGNGKYITEIGIPSMSLLSPDEKILDFDLDTTNYASGNYLAVAKVNYGSSGIAIGNDSFRLGELSVSIVNYTKNVERDRINQFDIQVRSNWNDKIDNVFANVTIQDNGISFLTPSVTLDNFGEGKLTGFFDTTGIENDFDVLISVIYGDKKTEEIVRVEFNKKVDYGFVGIIVAILVVLALILYVTYALRKTEKKRK